MNKTMKVAKWEIKRNLKNKSFLVSLFLTPLLFIGFMLVGSLLDDSEESDAADKTTTIYIKDELQVFPLLEETVRQFELNFELQKTDIAEDAVKGELEDSEETAYIFLTEKGLETGVFPVYTSTEMVPFFESQIQIFSETIKSVHLRQLGLSDEQLAEISRPFVFEQKSVDLIDENGNVIEEEEASEEDFLKKAVPAGFAGIILFSIVVTSMMIFTSASQEKKDKIAEIILSSVTPGDLMQGKIVGYFVLGMIQALVILLLGIPFVIYQFDIPIAEYLFVPETLLFVLIAVLGYLLFAAIFVGIGSTMADISTAGNFQGLVIMLPFLPLFFLGPVIANPDGMIAQIATYIPFSSPGILILRMALLDEWPWLEIIIALAILILSIWLFMKLAGKIFKVGILLYGKNATPQEIWKWLRA